MNFSSPMVSTVGGSMGLNFTYNSQSPVAYQPGLDAEYFNVDSFTNPPSSFPAGEPQLQRVDSAVNFNWGENSAPGSGVTKDYFLARWSGFISVPATGEYKFGFSRDDGARLTIDGSLVYNQWNAAHTKDWAAESVFLVGGTRIPVLIEFAERRGAAQIEMLSKFVASGTDIPTPSFTGVSEKKVPASWFSRDASILPGGWASSAPIAGNGGFFTSAQVNDNSIVLTDVSGSVHTFTRKADKSWKPPSDAYGTIAVDSSGKVTYTDLAGYTHAFASNGNLTSSSGPSEVTRPAEPQAKYDGNSRRVTKIIDPVSAVNPPNATSWGRELKFYYGGDSQCVSGAGEGYGDAPDGMLCQIVYPTQGSVVAPTTDLFYTTVETGDDEVAFLSAIRDPGNEWTVFDYDSSGKLSSITDSTGNDYLTYYEANVNADTSAIDDLIRTDISYDVEGRVAQVLLPSADPEQATQRTGRVYEYDDATNTTQAFAYAPGSGNNVLLSTVTYDDIWRATSTTSPMGITSSQQWHPSKDMLVASIDPAGRKSTTVYDREDRPVASYGPAPASCFTGAEPNGTCSEPVPASTTGYDEGWQGLQVQYWPNRYLSGQPTDFALDLSQNLAPNGVDLNLGSGGFSSNPSKGDDWGIRLIGEIEFPSVGDWTLTTYADDGTRVWVDDILVLDDWSTTGSTKETTIAFLPVLDYLYRRPHEVDPHRPLRRQRQRPPEAALVKRRR
ncbi:MAG: PA14 domain-containing protein [Microcella pacifica]